jgi:hypothetical protein
MREALVRAGAGAVAPTITAGERTVRHHLSPSPFTGDGDR